MRRLAFGIGVLLTGAGLLSCGGARPAAAALPAWARSLPPEFPLQGALDVHPEERVQPSLRARFPWANDDTLLGWGGVHLWARPANDEVQVQAILDAPADKQRWGGCGAMTVEIDGRPTRVEAQYIGRNLQGAGAYDAVQVDLDIGAVRRMAVARSVRGEVCGDLFELSETQLHTLRRFVSWFDRMAAPVVPEELPPHRDVGPDVILPGEEYGPIEPTQA